MVAQCTALWSSSVSEDLAFKGDRRGLNCFSVSACSDLTMWLTGMIESGGRPETLCEVDEPIWGSITSERPVTWLFSKGAAPARQVRTIMWT